MKEAAKIFATIAALLLGAYWAWDGLCVTYYSHAEPAETVAGLLLIAGGFTAIWLRYGKNFQSEALPNIYADREGT